MLPNHRMLAYLLHPHSHLDRLANDVDANAIAVILHVVNDEEALMFDDVDVLDDEAFHSLHDDIVAATLLRAHNERQREQEHAKLHVEMPFLVVFELVELKPCAFLALQHRQDDERDVNGVNAVPKDRMVAKQPMDYLQHHLSLLSQNLNLRGSDSAKRAHDGDLLDGGAYISFRWHRQHF